jgi:hypothetical protein
VMLEPAHDVQQARVARLDCDRSDCLFGHAAAGRRWLVGRKAGARKRSAPTAVT